MSVRRIDFTAGEAGRASEPDILLERNTDYHLMTSDTHDFAANLLEKMRRDVLQDLSAQDQIKRLLAKI